jgi:hypothetical protein
LTYSGLGQLAWEKKGLSCTLRYPSHEITPKAAEFFLMQCAKNIFQTLSQRPDGWDDQSSWLFWKHVRNDLVQSMTTSITDEKERRIAANTLCAQMMPEGLPGRDCWLLKRTCQPDYLIKNAPKPLGNGAS